MASEMPELRPVWEWTCEQCGADNIYRVATKQMTPADIRAGGIRGAKRKREIIGAMADTLKCRHCGMEFET